MSADAGGVGRAVRQGFDPGVALQNARVTHSAETPEAETDSQPRRRLIGRLVRWPIRWVLRHLGRPLAPYVRHLVFLSMGDVQAHLGEQLRSNAAELDRLRSVLNDLQESRQLPQRACVRLDEQSILIRTNVGFMICPADDPAVLSVLLDTGDLEPGTRRVIQRFLRPGDTFVDVGAHIGIHTIAGARSVGDTGRVISFEPYFTSAECIRRSAQINGVSARVEVIEKAVSNITSTVTLHLGQRAGWNSLLALDSDSSGKGGECAVESVTLDSVLAGQRVDLVKIDVEGAELLALEGMRQCIADNPHIALIVEFGPSHLARVGVSPAEWLAEFELLGLHWCAIDDASGVVRHASMSDIIERESTNLFLARPSSSAWKRLISHE